MRSDNNFAVQEHSWIVYLAFSAATVISFGFCLVTGQFNGDFFPQPVYSSTGSLVIVLVACLAPYFATWRAAGFFDRIRPQRRFEAAPQSLVLLMLFILGAHIVVTVLYGVGVMDQEVYTAPPQVRPFIQVLNRIDPFYVGAFFILATPKRLTSDGLVVSLMLATGLLRAGLGVFNYVLIAMSIKYSAEILKTVRTAPWLSVGAALAIPFAISALYEFRGKLRGDAQSDLNVYEMVLGRFFGRLSSYSNVAYIEQNAQSFVWAAKNLEPLYYIKQGAASAFGATPPSNTPERLLIAGTRSYEGFSTFMAGIPGNLFMAWSVSPWVALLNLGLISGSVAAILWLSRYFGNEKAGAFGLAMLAYPLTSGVANEIALLLVNTIVLLALTIVFDRSSRGARHYVS